MIFRTALQWVRHYLKQSVDSQKTPHTSPLRASYGVSVVRMFKKIDCVITALHCVEGYCKPLI